MRKLTYRDRWQSCIENGWYDFSLDDGSFFQMRFSEDHLSYSFMQCPFDYMSFEDFAYDKLGEEWVLFEPELREEYEFYRSNETSEQSVTPIRYDYEPSLYREGFHPAGHVHFGIDNEIRIGTKKIFTPLTFTLFVVRQHYPLLWERVLAHEKIEIISREIRDNLPAVHSNFFGVHDAREHYLV